MTRTITLESPAMPLLLGEPALVVTRLQGEESLSALYNYTVTATTPDNSNISWQAASAIDIKSLIGKQMTLRIALNDWRTDTGTEKAYREITGIVQQVRYLGRRNNCALYQMVLRPWLYLAELTSDFRIFQNKTVTEIIGEILADYDFPHEKRISETYPPLEYQVQYGETDFAFIQRLMEAWGLYWFFEHQGQQHKLVIVDNIGAHKPFLPAARMWWGMTSKRMKTAKNILQNFITCKPSHPAAGSPMIMILPVPGPTLCPSTVNPDRPVLTSRRYLTGRGTMAIPRRETILHGSGWKNRARQAHAVRERPGTDDCVWLCFHSGSLSAGESELRIPCPGDRAGFPGNHGANRESRFLIAMPFPCAACHQNLPASAIGPPTQNLRTTDRHCGRPARKRNLDG